MNSQQATQQLRELGYSIDRKAKQPGFTAWRLGALTVYVPQNSRVSDGIIKSARRNALLMSIENLPVKEPKR